MVGPGIWRETLKNMKNQNCTLQDLEYGEKTDQKAKSETHMVGPGIWRKRLKNVQNEKHVLQDLDCGKKIKKLGNVTHTVGPGICREF